MVWSITRRCPAFPVASSYGGGIRPSTNDGSGMVMSNPERLALERGYLRRSGPVPDILSSGRRAITPGLSAIRKLSGCWRTHRCHSLYNASRGKLNVQFSWSRPAVKEGTRSVDQGATRDRRCARSFWQHIRERNRNSKAVSISSRADRSGTKSALGKSFEKQIGAAESCADSWEADALG